MPTLPPQLRLANTSPAPLYGPAGSIGSATIGRWKKPLARVGPPHPAAARAVRAARGRAAGWHCVHVAAKCLVGSWGGLERGVNTGGDQLATKPGPYHQPIYTLQPQCTACSWRPPCQERPLCCRRRVLQLHTPAASRLKTTVSCFLSPLPMPSAPQLLTQSCIFPHPHDMCELPCITLSHPPVTARSGQRMHQHPALKSQ